MKEKIENPKVFISYAWGSDEYQSKVLSFASQLRSDGIDTIFDKWDLTEGNDTYAFMEQCVNDPCVTNVLMLLDPIYAKKADDHSGGVGTETQIISAKVYQEVTQDKFIPVVMERDEDGNICKPTYLQSRLHFDLSVADNYDKEYRRLVQKLYGVEVYAKPELGQKPSWVDNPIIVSTKSIVVYDSLKGSQTAKAKKDLFIKYLNIISDRILDFVKQHSNLDDWEYLELYASTESIKTDFLLLLEYTSYVDDSHKAVASFLEDTYNAIPRNYSVGDEIIRVFIHELFLYIIAHYLKIKDYYSVGYILGKTYFNQREYGYDSNADAFDMFYSGSEQTNLDNAVCTRDGTKYFSGTAQYWTSNVNTDFCSKEQFVLADLICFNYSVYGKNYIYGNAWFPVTYIYENRYNNSIEKIAKRMISREYLQEIIPLFDYDSADDFIEKIKSKEESLNIDYKIYRYSGAFESAPLLGYYIKAEQIAKLR